MAGARSDPGAVMVHLQDARVAQVTVVRPRRFDCRAFRTPAEVVVLARAQQEARVTSVAAGGRLQRRVALHRRRHTTGRGAQRLNVKKGDAVEQIETNAGLERVEHGPPANQRQNVLKVRVE